MKSHMFRSLVICSLIIIWSLVFGAWNLPFLFAQDNDKLVTLSKKIIEAKTSEELYAPFEELKNLYFKDNKYSEFTDFLKSLGQKGKTQKPFANYYVALSRYEQLKYLEDKQKWDEYFSLGNAYRDELMQGAQKAIDATQDSDALNIYARLLLWQFHKDQQGAFDETAISGLMSSILEYSKTSSDTKPIKEVADRLLAYGEKAKARQLYRIYADKIITSNIKDEALINIASGFYKEGNLELSQTIYNFYIDRIQKAAPKEKIIPVLIDIARQFAYKDEGPKDPVYAEAIFERIEELGREEAFNQDLMYLRALNLEKTKEYEKAKDAYIGLVLKFPGASRSDEALFKVGIINAYVLRDIKEAMTYFGKLAQKETASPQSISSLYQLGLISQWEQDYVKAKEYYDSLIEKAKNDFVETVTLAKERLREIEEARPIEYNLKTFLDASLKEEYTVEDMSKVDLKCYPYIASKGAVVNISSTSYIGEAGCTQVELQYLWSGDFGSRKPSSEQAGFDTAYNDSGTKEINLVVVSSSGIIGRSFDLVDVY